MSGVESSVNTNINDIINHANSTIVDDIYKLNKDFYDGYQWIAALDSATCLACANIDNKIFDLLPDMEGEGTKPPDEPPLHKNCRCIIVPVLEGMRDDPSQAQASYEDWFNRQDEATKLDILGPARYKEYANGKAVTAFAKDGRIATLDELRVDRITRAELIRGNIFKGETISELIKVKGDLPSYFDKVSEDDWQKIIQMIKNGEMGNVGRVIISIDGIENSKGDILVPKNILIAIDDKLKNPKLNPLEIIADYIKSGTALTDDEKKEFRKWVGNSMMANFPKNEFSPAEMGAYAKNVTDYLGKFPPQLQRALFETRPEIHFFSLDKNTAFFSLEEKTLNPSLNFGLNTLTIDKEGARKFFHELAHALDYRLAKMTGISAIDAQTINRPSLIFYDLLQNEFEKKIAELSKKGLLDSVLVTNENEETNPFWNVYNRGASDIFRGLSDEKYNEQKYGGCGKHTTYTKGQTVPFEAFAHFVSEYVEEVGMKAFFKDTFTVFSTWFETGKLP